MNSNDEENLSLSKAADLLGVTTKTIRNWDDKGKIRTIRTPGNHRRIPVSEVTRLLQEERLTPGETLAGLRQESEAYMGRASATPTYPLTPFMENTTKEPISPSEYKLHLKMFGLEDVEALKTPNKDLTLLPDLNLGGELNRDEAVEFTRSLIHKIEDILNSRLKDEEFTAISNIVASVHSRSSLKEKKTPDGIIRPGKPSGLTSGVNATKDRLGYLGD